MKTAVIQCADTGPVESLIAMLREAGYSCYRTSKVLNRQLREAGCDTVLDAEDLVRGMGYEYPMGSEAGEKELNRCDLFVDVKAHRNYPRLVKRWPRLEKRVLWYRINGGRPEHVIKNGEDYGDEVNPPCPVLTPNQWYHPSRGLEATDYVEGTAVHGKAAYVCWPPFVRLQEHYRGTEPWRGSPICLIHNAVGWGYGRLFEPLRKLGVYIFGNGSPDGLIQHQKVPEELANALAYVHLKSSDAPGYALYEALAAACPVICSRRLIWRCRMQELLIPGETCLVFDRETHEGLTDEDVMDCTATIKSHLEALRNPAFNRALGERGREQLQQIMWGTPEDIESLKDFLRRNFP